MRIICPPIHLTKAERKNQLLSEMETWLKHESLLRLIKAFGGTPPLSISFPLYIDWMNSFADCWDYRKKQAEGGERWNIDDDEQIKLNEETIMSAAFDLGYLDGVSPAIEQFDYMLPLGGARLANLNRCQYTKTLLDRYGKSTSTVVALAGKRSIQEIEVPYLKCYAPDAATEYDAICGGLEKTFEIGFEFKEQATETNNINLAWSIREYQQRYLGHSIFAVAAPSSIPNRRANTFDTFVFFLKKFSVQPESSLLLCSNCIYVNYQLLKFIPLALEKNLFIDCVGTPPDHNKTFNKPVNYCQEIKGTINAMHDIYTKIVNSKSHIF